MTRNVATVLIIQAILKKVIGRRFTDKRVEKMSWCCDGFCAPPEQFKYLTQISGGRGLATLIWRCALPPTKEFRVQSQRLFYFHLTGIPRFNYIRLDHGKIYLWAVRWSLSFKILLTFENTNECDVMNENSSELSYQRRAAESRKRHLMEFNNHMNYCLK